MADQSAETPPKAPGNGDKPEKAPAAAYRRLQYCVLGREGLEFKLGPTKKRGEIVETDNVDERFQPSKIENVKDVEYSPSDGSKVLVLQASGFTVFNTDTAEQVCKVEHPGIFKMAFSPLGTFVLSWQKHMGGNEGNLILWRVEDGSIVFRVVEKNLLATTWPSVQFSSDEKVAAHMVKNKIHVYRDSDFSTPAHAIKSEGLKQFSMCKQSGEMSEENPVKFVTFIPEGKGKPAKLALFNYPGSSDRPIGGKTFFKAEEAVFKWSPLGNAVLCKTETSVDTTGQSYYGESALYLLHSDGLFDCSILPAKEGSFHDFAWSPQGKHFVTIAGKSPASSNLYNLKGEAIFDFGQAHRNTIRWSPHGRFLCLGGFGNLLGDMDFWDINKKSKMGSTRANCAVTQEWSPCGRFFMTSTLFPRMRVDNGMTFWTYRGEQLHTVLVREASKALWRPAAPGVYADRPQTPLKKIRKAQRQAAAAAAAANGSGATGAGAGVGNGSSGASSTSQNVKPKPQPEKKKQAYRPPGASGSLAAMMRKERQGSSAPRTLAQLSGDSGGLSGSGSKPGGPSSSSSSASSSDKPQKSKAALRRERKKKAAAKKAAEAAAN